MLTFWIFHESDILVMTSHFSKSYIYGSTIVEFTGRQTWKQNWKHTFDCKLVYTLGKTVQDMVLDSYVRQIAGGQVTFSDVFNVIFEITTNRHLFLVFLWLTLNIEQSYITATYCLTEKRLHLKLLLGFSAEPIRTPSLTSSKNLDKILS